MESWQGCRKTIHTRWERLGRGLAKLLEQDARIESLSNREQTLVADLRRLGVAKVSEGRVIHIDWDKFADVTVEDINTITQKMIKL